MENIVNTTHSAVGILATNCNTVIHTGDITVQNIQTETFTSKFPIPPLIETFRGRSNQLEKLTSIFIEEKKLKVVITGHGGIGKTELAKQFGHHMLKQGYVEEVMWFNAENMSSYKKNKATELYETFKNNICLCIFDNVLSVWDIEDFKPISSNFYILLTSQERVLGYEEIILETLPLEAALQVIKAVLSEDYNQNFENYYVELAQMVSCVPLGLQVAAAYIKKRVSTRNSNITNLIKYLQKGILQLTIPRMMNNPYQKSIYCVTSAMLDRMFSATDELPDVLDLSKYILCIISFLNPDHIDLSYLLNIIHSLQNKSFCTENNILDCINFVESYNLISFKNQKIYVHRLMLYNIRYYFQSKYFDDIFFDCYSGCLLGVTIRDIRIHHSNYIFNYAEENMSIILKFFICNKDDLTRSKISRLLIENNCCVCIKNISKNVENFKDFINKKLLLHIAILYNHFEMVQCLLLIGCDIQHKSVIWGGETPLLLAARMGDLKIINLLVESGSDIQASDNLDALPLQAYCRRVKTDNFTEIIQILNILCINHFWNVSTKTNGNLLHIACDRHNKYLLNYFIENFNLDVNKQDNNGNTPLHVLCFCINGINEDVLSSIQLLLSRKPDLSLKNVKNETYLDILKDNSVKFNFDINFYLSKIE